MRIAALSYPKVHRVTGDQPGVVWAMGAQLAPLVNSFYGFGSIEAIIASRVAASGGIPHGYLRCEAFGDKA
jgi:hypothetical protein